MFQAFVDDSVGRPLFVLAGAVAPAEQWARFSDEWREVLEMRPRMEYLKMSEANMRGWEDDRFRERLQRFYRLIEQHVSCGFSITIDSDAFWRVRNDYFPRMKGGNEYHLALSQLIYWLAARKADLGITKKMELIVDQQMFEEAKIRENWQFIYDNLSDEARELLSSAPIFRNDKEVMPLQAADMLAWWTRRRAVERIEGIEDEKRVKVPWTPQRAILWMDVSFNERDIANFYLDKMRIEHRSITSFRYGYGLN